MEQKQDTGEVFITRRKNSPNPKLEYVTLRSHPGNIIRLFCGLPKVVPTLVQLPIFLRSFGAETWVCSSAPLRLRSMSIEKWLQLSPTGT